MPILYIPHKPNKRAIHKAMKNITFLFFLCCLSFPTIAQLDQSLLDDNNRRRILLSRNGMIAFNTWSLANTITGTVGVFTAKNAEVRHFHEMNIYWNIVNLGIGIPGLISAIKEKPEGVSWQKSLKKQNASEKVFLLNGALDLAYITSGFLLREIGRGKTQKLQDRLRGYGDSLVMQGGFLLLFDFAMYALHARNGKRLHKHLDALSISPYEQYGMGLSIRCAIK